MQGKKTKYKPEKYFLFNSSSFRGTSTQPSVTEVASLKSVLIYASAQYKPPLKISEGASSASYTYCDAKRNFGLLTYVSYILHNIIAHSGEWRTRKLIF